MPAPRDPAGCAGYYGCLLGTPVLRELVTYGIWGPWVTWPQVLWRFVFRQAGRALPILRTRSGKMPLPLRVAAGAGVVLVILIGWLIIEQASRSQLVAGAVQVAMTWPESAVMPWLAKNNVCLALPVSLVFIGLRLMLLSFLFSLVALAPVHWGLILWNPGGGGSVSYTERVAGRSWLPVRAGAHETVRPEIDPSGEVYFGQSLTLKNTRAGAFRAQGAVIPVSQRVTHMWVVGGTGAGKTRSVLEPIIRADILAGRPIVVIDGKADAETMDRIWSYAVQAGREDEVRYFHLAEARRSDTYNPFLHGTATELKDKVICSFEQQEGLAKYYRDQSQHLLLDVFNALRDAGQPAMLHDLYACAGDPDALKELFGMAKSPEIRSELERHILRWEEGTGKSEHIFSGIHTHLGLMVKSEFGHLLKTYNPDIDILDVYQNGGIVYFGLPTLTYQESARALARIILQDLKAVAGIVQTKMRENERAFMSVVVDEFAAFAFDDFSEFLNKARASQIGLVLSHQSLGGDLKKAGDAFFRQVVTNTNTKVALRQDDPDDSLYFARIGGTFKDMKATIQTESEIFGLQVEKGRSYREEREYLLPPDLIQTLERGHAAVVMKQPHFGVDVIALDHPSPEKLYRFERPERTYSAPATSKGACLGERAAQRKSAKRRGTTMPSQEEPGEKPRPRRKVKRRPKKEGDES